MGKEWVFYTPDGRIHMTGRMTEVEAELTLGITPEMDLRKLEAPANYFLDYVVDGAVRARPANPAYLDGMTLHELPMPSTIYVDGAAYPCDDDTADLDLDLPGTYVVRVESWPFLDTSFEVTRED